MKSNSANTIDELLTEDEVNELINAIDLSAAARHKIIIKMTNLLRERTERIKTIDYLSDGRKASKQHQKGIPQLISEKTKMTKRQIQRIIKAGESE